MWKPRPEQSGGLGQDEQRTKPRRGEINQPEYGNSANKAGLIPPFQGLFLSRTLTQAFAAPFGLRYGPGFLIPPPWGYHHAGLIHARATVTMHNA